MSVAYAISQDLAEEAEDDALWLTPKPRRRVLLSHPHAAAVACGFSAALAKANRLAGFATGVAFIGDTHAGKLAIAAALQAPVLNNRILQNIPPERLLSMPLVELGARMLISGLHAFGSEKHSRYDAIFLGHDAAVAQMNWPRDTGALYAYEDGALWSFERAARRGIPRIWDLPLPHYQTIEDMWRDEVKRWPGATSAPRREPQWKKHRKDAELALATHIVVASAFTKQSLERLNVQLPIAVIPYGFPVEAFQARTVVPQGKFTVLAVGTQDLRKGTPYLLEAWRQAAIPNAELHLIGPLKLSKAFLARYEGLYRHSPTVAKSDLGQHYSSSDLVAFPTLGDGFGLVMQEAMSCGTPVVTTPCGGGPECIDDGVDGWLVPPRSIEALVERFRWCAANREKTFAVGRAARARAERWTWLEAGELVTEALAV